MTAGWAERRMQFLADLFIILVLLSAIYVGIARGLWGPLLTEGALLVAFFIDTRLVMPIVGAFLPLGWLLTGVGVVLFFAITIGFRILARPLFAILQRLPITRRIDAPGAPSSTAWSASSSATCCWG